ncbi:MULTISPECIES: hypothetical protein [Streptomyces]|uniref:hypothetical protein n=1 Tax=Streptomyces TaxID=1883 RepID=UPI000F556289|nr:MULTISPECIES: hypothetical protein [Streptomyces]WRY84067.1 hypothetical protein OG388_23930 [Streptomyces clavifer]WUC29833.1 hypothetical protein OG927_21835 [Streptomyces clavifer]
MDEETHHPAKPAVEQVTCARCGATADGDIAPPTWICSVEDGRSQYFCDACSRTHLRAIESRLDSACW